MLCACALLLAGVTAAAAAEPNPACAAKRSDIEQQIERAHAHGNAPQLAGLQRALQANSTRCTDADLARERARRIADAEQEVAERERDLREAEQRQDAEKIATRRSKLDEARHELERSRKPPPH